MKQALLILATVLMALEAQAQSYNEQRQGDQYQQNQPDHQPSYQQNTPPQYQPAPGRWVSQRHRFNYFKGSIGFASVDDYSDSTGEINYDSSAFMPINLAYGATSGNVAFEAELGFSAYDYEYNPVFGSSDPSFDGDLGASKLMFNGMFKTSQTGSNFYIGGGLGFLSVAIDGIEDELSGSSLATQFIVGGEVRQNERSSFFIEYKQLSSVNLELENAFTRLDYDFEEASLNVGVKYYF